MALIGAPLSGKLLALPTKVRLGRKGLPGTNTVTYIDRHSIAKTVLQDSQQVPHLGAPLLGKLLALPTNIR